MKPPTTDMSTKNPDSEFTSFNPAMLQDLSNGNSEFIKEMVSIFLEDVPTAVDEMDTAMAKADYTTVGQIAHKIKSSVGMVGAEALHALVSNIEDSAETTDGTKNLPSMLEELRGNMAKCYSELAEYSQSI